MTEDVGGRIQERRARLALSVKGLAQRAGVDRGRLAEIEAGKAKNVRATTIAAIERALDELEARKTNDETLPGVRPIGDPADNLVEVLIEGTDVRVVVKGPIRTEEERDALQAFARGMIADIKGNVAAAKSRGTAAP